MQSAQYYFKEIEHANDIKCMLKINKADTQNYYVPILTMSS